MDIITKIISKLPSVVHCEGCEFTFEIFHDYNELRLSYKLTSCEEGSRHYKEFKGYQCWDNKFMQGSETQQYFCTFLYLAENITTLEKLESAVDRCIEFLTENKLIES